MLNKAIYNKGVNKIQGKTGFLASFNVLYLVGSEKVLTHTHRPDLLISFFIRARRSYANPLNNGTPASFVVPFFMPFCQAAQEGNNAEYSPTK